MWSTKHIWQILRALVLSAEAKNSISILIFHRVMAEKDPLRPGEPDAKEFDEIIRFVSENFRVRSLYDAVVKQKRSDKSGHAVAITFDDGYSDNLKHALPILRKYRTSATFFVASGFLDGGIMWNDQIIEGVRSHEDTMLDARAIGLELYDTSDTDSRRKSIRALISGVKYRPDQERREIASWILGETSALPPKDMMLTANQLRELADDDLTEIGGHTISHPILKRLPMDDAFREIVEGKRELEKITGNEIRCFAYPNGIPNSDYGIEHVEMVSKAGFELAVTTSPGAARKDTDQFQLPRFTPWDRKMPLFGLRLLTIARSANVAPSPV